MNRRTVVSRLALASLVAGCKRIDVLNALVPSNDVSLTRDVAYGAEPRQRLDIYQPSGKGDARPIVVFLYGGGWREGEKADYPFVAEPLARSGFVVVVPDYRLYPQVQFPVFVQDCAQAVAWSLAHAGSLGGHPAALSVVGHSAGAYNAAMLALDPAWLREAGTSREALASVVGLAGPYDFLPISDPDVIPIFASVGDGPASQPISYVDGHNPPMLLLAGDADTTVQPRNTSSLAARIHDAGGPVEAKLYPGIGHLGIIVAFAPVLKARAPVLADVATFVGRYRAASARAGTQTPSAQLLPTASPAPRGSVAHAQLPSLSGR